MVHSIFQFQTFKQIYNDRRVITKSDPDTRPQWRANLRTCRNRAKFQIGRERERHQPLARSRSKLRFHKSDSARCSTSGSGNQPWSILPGNILRWQEERKVVMESNKEKEIYLRTTMTAAFVMKLNGRPEKRCGLTFTNIVITGQFPSLNRPTVGSTNLFSWMGFTFNNFLH